MYDRVTGLPYDKIYSFDGFLQEEASMRTLHRSIIEEIMRMARNEQYDGMAIKDIVERYAEAWPLNFEAVDKLIGELQFHGLTDQKHVLRYHRLKAILLNGGVSSNADAATILGICVGAYNHRKSEARKRACPSEHFLNLLEEYQKQAGDHFCNQLKSAGSLYKAIHASSSRR